MGGYQLPANFGAGGSMPSNQYFGSLPSMPANNQSLMARPAPRPVMGSGDTGMFPSYSSNTPGVVPPQGGGGGGFQYNPSNTQQPNQYGHSYTQPTVAPQLSQNWVNYLKSQVGQGVAPFNLSTALPTGGATQPGQINAPFNSLLQMLMSGFQGHGSNVPGQNTLSTIANQGISALPEWQSMIAAQGQNTQQNLAQLKEQFAAQGSLAGSPFGTATSNYMQQTNLDQNALLAQLQQQNILQGQIPVAQGMQQGATQLGEFGQGMDQQAIQNMMQEFIRTSPQYNPMNQNMQQLATTFAPLLPQQPVGGGILGGLMSGLGGILGSIPGLSSLFGGGGAAAGAAGGAGAAALPIFF